MCSACGNSGSGGNSGVLEEKTQLTRFFL